MPAKRSAGNRQTRAPKSRKTPARKGRLTAFVLAGGGSLGAVQVGMLKALMQRRVVPDLVVGASVGAINSAYFAGRPDAKGTAQLEQIWLGIRQEDVFPVSLRAGLGALLGRRNYFVEPDNLARLIGSLLPFKDFADAALPCHVVATDIYNGQNVCFSEGDAPKAVLASASIPAVYPPVQYGDRYLVDGGVASNTPISSAVALGAQRVIVLPTGFSCSITEPPRTVVAAALHSLNLMIMQQLVRDTALYADRAEIVVVPPLCPVDVTPYDFSQTASLIRRAETSTAEWLLAGGLESVEVPHTLVPHHDGDDPDFPYLVPQETG
ncbi:MAG: patatin-like phospholipase family protein [Nevskia sp.]|nr:patatin-like phospholipase family protein [Nevskia sp.]